jgi:hypothetical protein
VGLACTVTLFAAGVVAAQASGGFPIVPSRLVAPPSSVPALSGGHARLTATRSPTTWAFAILQDERLEGEAEILRLKREGFLEGLRELIAATNGFAFSGAMVLANHTDARSETQTKANEEQQETGPGTIRFAVPTLKGAIGLSRHGPSQELQAGEYETSILFTAGKCVIATGIALTPAATQAAVQQAAETIATRLAARVRHACG